MKAMPAVLLATLLTGCGVPKDQVDALNAELQTAQQRADELSAQLTAANNTNTTLTAQLAAAHAQITELAPLAAKAKELPVAVTTRPPGILERGHVWQLRNRLDRSLPVKIKVANSTFNKEYQIVLEPYNTVGLTEWVANQGDTIEVTSGGYDTLTKRFE